MVVDGRSDMVVRGDASGLKILRVRYVCSSKRNEGILSEVKRYTALHTSLPILDPIIAIISTRSSVASYSRP